MSRVKPITSDDEYQAELSGAGYKLVVVDFSATWCGPCRNIEPKYDELSQRFPLAVFLKVDVDKNPQIATRYAVTAMPTFLFFKNKVKIDKLQGSDSAALEAKIVQHYDTVITEPSEIPGHVDLTTFIMKDQCTSLNETDNTKIANLFEESPEFLESECDEQLILSVTFSQRVKLHSIKLKAPSDLGPKNIKIFVNLPGNLDFSSAESLKPIQELELTEEYLQGKPINLKYVKFQSVQTIDLFITSNQNDGEVTRVDQIGFIGSPIYGATNMDDFKRVAGKKGEGHA